MIGPVGTMQRADLRD